MQIEMLKKITSIYIYIYIYSNMRLNEFIKTVVICHHMNRGDQVIFIILFNSLIFAIALFYD